ncbi:MAG: hypothetical protein HRT87_06505 [Legionellales bacterium]|nr:hypothetical protein [Legionellales bacterium]
MGRKDMMISPNLRSSFEMLIIRMIFFQPSYDKLKYHEQLDTKKINISQQIKSISEIVDKPKKDNSKSEIVDNPKKDTSKNDSPDSHTQKNTSEIDWNLLVKKLDLKGASKIVAEHCHLKIISDNNMQLVLDIEQNNLLSENIKNQILEAIQNEFNENIKFSIIIGENNSKNTPHALQKKQMLSDKDTKEIIDKLDAELTDITIKKK